MLKSRNICRPLEPKRYGAVLWRYKGAVTRQCQSGGRAGTSSALPASTSSADDAAPQQASRSAITLTLQELTLLTLVTVPSTLDLSGRPGQLQSVDDPGVIRVNVVSQTDEQSESTFCDIAWTKYVSS